MEHGYWCSVVDVDVGGVGEIVFKKFEMKSYCSYTEIVIK